MTGYVIVLIEKTLNRPDALLKGIDRAVLGLALGLRSESLPLSRPGGRLGVVRLVVGFAHVGKGTLGGSHGDRQPRQESFLVEGRDVG